MIFWLKAFSARFTVLTGNLDDLLMNVNVRNGSKSVLTLKSFLKCFENGKNQNLTVTLF